MSVLLQPGTILPFNFIEFLHWENIDPQGPSSTTRNRWLWMFGAFAKYRGIWFPCNIAQWNVMEQPLVITVIRTTGSELYSSLITDMVGNTIPVDELEALYTVFPIGYPIVKYVSDVMPRIQNARDRIDDAIARSLETGIMKAPRRYSKPLKRALNMIRKGLWYVVEGQPSELEQIAVVPVPDTTSKLEPLWNSYDWSRQELYLKMGFAFNPEKRERMIASEMEAQTEIIKSNRIMLTNMLKTQAAENGLGERVEHMCEYLIRTGQLNEQFQTPRMISEEIYDSTNRP